MLALPKPVAPAQLELFKTFSYEDEDHHFTNVRTKQINGEIWFVVNDVCACLGIGNGRHTITRLDPQDVITSDVLDSNRRTQKTNMTNESGLYELIFHSRKPEARRFKRWVTKEVLPTIRKTGGYGIRHTPIFVQRFNANWDRVENGHFSVISELYIRLFGKLETAGYILPDVNNLTGEEIRPDVSVGKLFPKWLDTNHPEYSDSYKFYRHKLPSGQEINARQYSNDVLPHFIEFTERVWIPQHAERYLEARCKDALTYLPKLLKSK